MALIFMLLHLLCRRGAWSPDMPHNWLGFLAGLCGSGCLGLRAANLDARPLLGAYGL